ncbi:zinc finger transcriptional activator [Gnomoniopsis smithogilvyi]|uniref:Zinc finger transcriptional activator n=1 Tax=Gnomoniopsis smithogilvyi TaxID=1191159 RepID=A0A9W8YTG9_9PEZI|nr:zinc finger transcriptional activator [Gnomoniopsis smithogilvyi]
MAQASAQAGAGTAAPSAHYTDASPPPAPAPTTSSSAPNTQQHKRVYQACIPCRRRKVRCDLGSVDNPHDPPCVRCRRESKECYFSATRRKRKTDDEEAEEAAREDDAYIIRNGRKRPHTDASPPPVLDRRIYSDQPLTPGGSVGRHQPLRRPGPGEHTRSDSRSSVTGASRGRSGTEFGGGEEPNTPLENYEARTVMRKEVYGPHDALDLLYKAATDKTHEHETAHHHTQGPSPQVGVQTPSLSGPGRGSDGMVYAQHAAALHQRGSVHDAPIDPMLTGEKAEGRVSEPAPAPAHADALRAWTRFRFVRAGWFTAQEAVDYVDYYYKYLSPLTPISPPTFQDPATHLTLLTEEPILAVTLLTIASRYRKLPGTGGLCRANAIHEQLWTYLRGMIERVIWGQEAFGGGFCGSGADESQTSSTAPWRGLRKGSLRTLGTIESLMILTEWHPRALHFPPAEAIDELMIPVYEAGPPAGTDGTSHPAISMGGRRVESWLEPAWRSDRMCWMLLNAAMGLAYELGVFDNIDELLDSEAISRPEYLEETYRLRADRIKRLILIYLSQLAGRLGWTNMVPENLRKTTTMQRRRPTSSAVEGTTPDDAIIHCWAGISNAMHIGNERLFGSRKHTTEIITTGRYVELLKEFQPMLQEWRIQFERYQLPPYIRHILTIEYEYVRIYVNSLSLQAVVERCANIASGQTGAVPNNAASSAPTVHQLSPKTQDIYGKMPIGNIGGVSAADQEYIREVMEGSRNLLRTVVEGLLPDDYLKHAPVRTYFRIISGAMFLLKTFALGATRHDVEVSIRLMDSTVEALRTCVVDDVHLGIRFADLLENLTMRLRNRFIYVANPTSQTQANSADGKSPVPEAGLGGNLHVQHGLGINGHDHIGWPRIHAPERAITPANISATPFDIPSNFPMPSNFNGGPGPGPATPAAPGLSAGIAPDTNSANSTSMVSDMFGGGDGQDWAAGPANDMWFLPAGPAFFQNVGGPGDSGVGMSAEGINVGGMDLLDYMAMDQYPMDGGGPL